MKNVIIACAGGYGVEAYLEMMNVNAHYAERGRDEPFHFLGFLSDIPVDLESQGIHEKILGTIDEWQPSEDEYFFIGLSRPDQKKAVADRLVPKGARFISIVSPYAFVSDYAKIGDGCLVTGGSKISWGVEIGNFVNVNSSLLQSGTKVGDFSTTTAFAILEGCELGTGVFVGTKAVITDGCHIGDWAQVYVGSVVMQDVEPGISVFGMPAKRM